jgi:hypothetical protein
MGQWGISVSTCVESRTSACRCIEPSEGGDNVALLRRWAWALTGVTIAWNSLEAIVSLVSGMLAGSIALVGFGLDSVVEVSSALVIVWRLRQPADSASTAR